MPFFQETKNKAKNLLLDPDMGRSDKLVELGVLLNPLEEGEYRRVTETLWDELTEERKYGSVLSQFTGEHAEQVAKEHRAKKT